MAELQMQLSRIKSNILPRLRLLRVALGRRFVYRDIVEMARSYGLEYRDVVADVEPFEFAEAVLECRRGNYPDFQHFQNDAHLFTIPGLPTEAVSEPSAARFIGKLVFELNARVVIELGPFSGWSSAHIAWALHLRNVAAQLYCVELHEKHIEALRSNLARYGLDSGVKIIHGSSLDKAVLDQLPSSADVIFLDTSHTYPATRNEILTYSQRLAPNGCFILHDSISAVGVRRSLGEIPRELRRMSFATEAGNGVTVLMRTEFFERKRAI
jgi:predicted O-methyltransferase YrrM